MIHSYFSLGKALEYVITCYEGEIERGSDDHGQPLMVEFFRTRGT